MKFPRTNIVYSLILVVAATLAGGDLLAQTTFTAHEDSRLWIEGRSNVNTFECMAKEYVAEAILPEFENTDQISDPNNLGTDHNATITVGIKVEGFECGRSRMNRDLNEALKSDEFPQITFTLKNATAITIPDDIDNGFEIEVDGSLTVAGVTREISFKSNGFIMDDGRIRAVGGKQIKMTDFNVEPPTALFGMVKAEDELRVRFDLIGVKN